MRITKPSRAGLVVLAAALAMTSAVVAAPAGAAPGTGQTSTISGVVKNYDGTPAAGEEVAYVNLVCDTGEEISQGEDDSSVMTDASGAFSFPAFATQCYGISAGDGVLENGVLHQFVVAKAGATNVTLTLASEIDLDLTVTGVPAGTQVAALSVMVMSGLKLWYPVSTGVTDAAGKTPLQTVKGGRYALLVMRSGDAYTQYVGAPASGPAMTGGPGTFTAPATGASFTQTVTPLKSSPVNVTITGADVGADINSMNWGSLSLFSGGATDETTEAGSITLRGLTPGATDIMLSGTNGATHVFGEARNVTVTSNIAVPVNASIAASSSDNSLSTTGEVVVTTSGSLQVGSQLTAQTTFVGDAAQYADLPTTSVSTYWLSGSYLVAGGSFKLRGQGSTLTIPGDLASDDLLLVFSIVRIAGHDPIMATGYAWASPALVSAMGSGSPFPSGDIQAGATPFPSVIPSVSGNAVAGQTLTAAPGAWSSSPTGYKYQWARNGKAVAGATGRTLKLTGADVGARFAVTVTPIKAGHAVMSMTTAATGPVTKAAAKVTAKVKKKVKRGKKATVTVKVTAAGLTPSGKVTVKFGKKKVAKNLGKNGTVKIKSPKLKKKGKVKVRVTYAGDSAVQSAKLTGKQAKKLTVKVK